MKGCQKEQSRNIISGSDGKIIAASTIGLTVGDWNFSLVRRSLSPGDTDTCTRAREHECSCAERIYFRPETSSKHKWWPVNGFSIWRSRKTRCRGERARCRTGVAAELATDTENSPQGPRQFVVIHIRLGLPLAPSSRHLVGIGQLEFAVGSFPRDARGVTRVRQKLE